jgi:hypothetical protein
MREANPVISNFAAQGIAALGRALPRIVAEPADLDARADALFGAWACGSCLGAVGMSLHHKLCHVLGGTFGLPHAETHTVILPHAAAYNAGAAPAALDRLHARLARMRLRALCSILRQGMARRLRCGKSGCRSPISTRRLKWRCSPPTGTRVLSSGIRSGRFSTMPITAAGRLEQECDGREERERTNGGSLSGIDA